MSNPSFPQSPPDAAAEKAWDKIMEIAREHCLVVAAAGGTATLALPGPQKEAGVREKVLMMHRRSEHGQEELAL